MLTFLSLPIASIHLAFPLTKLSASAVPAVLMKFVLKEAASEAASLKLNLAARPCLYDVINFHST